MGILTEYDEDKVRVLWEDYWEERGEEKKQDEVLALIEQGLTAAEIKKILLEQRAAQPTR